MSRSECDWTLHTHVLHVYTVTVTHTCTCTTCVDHMDSIFIGPSNTADSI